MRLGEIDRLPLHRVIEETLEEYVSDCERDGYHKDKSGYIGQILSKVRLAGAPGQKGRG